MRGCFVLLACPKGPGIISGPCRMVNTPCPSTVGQGWSWTSMQTACPFRHWYCMPHWATACLLAMTALQMDMSRNSHLAMQACARLWKLKIQRGFWGLVTVRGDRPRERLIHWLCVQHGIKCSQMDALSFRMMFIYKIVTWTHDKFTWHSTCMFL